MVPITLDPMKWCISPSAPITPYSKTKLHSLPLTTGPVQLSLAQKAGSSNFSVWPKMVPEASSCFDD